MNRKILVLIAFGYAALMLGACSNIQTAEPQISETEHGTGTYAETIYMNNCGGTLPAEQEVSRYQTVTLEASAEVGLPESVMKLSISGKYGVTNGVGRTQHLSAAPGTNMEFVLLWTEDVYTGTVKVSGRDSEAVYRVGMPLSVELASSKKLDCPGTSTTPTPKACPAGAQCVAVDFSTLDPSLWCDVPSGWSLVEEALIATLTSTPSENAGLELHPCQGVDDQLVFVEATIRIENITGRSDYVYSGFGGQLGSDRYFGISIDGAGNAIVIQGVVDRPDQVISKIALANPQGAHTLRAEWAGSEVIFYADGNLLDVRLTADYNGNWFFISAVAWPAENSASFRIEQVEWGVKR